MYQTGLPLHSRFSGCFRPSTNFNIPLLYQMAERFGFIVDVRGPFPTMIKGQRAARYTSHRDALDFISVTFIKNSHIGVNQWMESL